ncbi:hypothetical protein GBA52_000121 [Prunus armeniaca]|nr:hypothetical protein GBA52_000121 [Prunus armeniaca]
MVDFDYDQLVKATESFSPTKLIGKGSHGMVYKAIVVNKLVAIKKPLDQYHAHQVSLLKLDNEICVLSSLPENPHVISLLGTSHQDSNKNKLLVMEFMPNGSLHDLLHVASTPPPWPKRVEIAIRVARAVQFLHQGEPMQRIEQICDARLGLPTYMSSTIRHMLNVAASCVSSDVACRPTMTDVVKEIENCFIERVRLPIWSNMLRSLVPTRMKKLAKSLQQAKCATEQSDADVPSGKLFLWQVLDDAADIG